MKVFYETIIFDNPVKRLEMSSSVIAAGLRPACAIMTNFGSATRFIREKVCLKFYIDLE
jgi:hypothetical protein